MKRRVGRLLLGIFGGLAVAVSGTDYPAARYGEAALGMGDYASAARFFTEYIAAAAGDAVALRDANARWIGLKLRTGDLDEAEKRLATLPSGDADALIFDILRGELLLFRAKYVEAVSYFDTLLKRGGLSTPQLCRVLAGKGSAELKTKNYEASAATFDKLEQAALKAPEWAFVAWSQRLEALLEAGNTVEARRLLTSGDRFQTLEQQRIREVLTLSLLLQEKNRAGFDALWSKIGPSTAPGDGGVFAPLAARAAELALAGKDPVRAAAYLGDAFNLSGDESARRSYLRRKINIEAESKNPARAAASLERYLELFPETPDRGGLLLELARLFSAAGEPSKSLAVYRKAMDAVSALSLEDRRKAALEGGQAAAAAKDIAGAEQFFRALTRIGSRPNEQQEGNFRLGELYYQEARYADAAAAFARATSASAWHDKALFRQLQSELRQEDYPALLASSIRLQRVKDKELAAEGDYYRALASEKTASRDAALELYAAFIREHTGNHHVPAALLASAELSFALKDYPAALRYFADFDQLSPEHPRQAAMQYLRLRAALLAGDASAAEQARTALQKRFPASPFLVDALLLRFDNLRLQQLYPEALAILKELAALPAAEQPELAAQLRYDRATILFRLGDAKAAMAELKEVRERFVAAPVFADAALLEANYWADSGDYQQAAALYARVLELRPGGLSAAVVTGRLADCYFSLHASKRDGKSLEQARELYERLTRMVQDDALLLQSYFKYGKCCELEEKFDAAQEAYKQVLYLAIDQKKRGVAPDPVWPSKAAYASALLYLKRGTPGAAREAMTVLRVFDSLELGTGENMTEILESIRKKYKVN